MLVYALSFFAGCYLGSLVQFPTSIAVAVVFLSAIGILFFCPWQRRYVVVCSLIGCSWALAYSVWILSCALPTETMRRDIIVVGTVVDLPTSDRRLLRSQFQVERYYWQGQWHTCHTRWRLSWYYPDKKLQAAERWRLRVRWHTPHGLSNPGGRNTVLQLRQQGVTGVAYVRRDSDNSVLTSSVPKHYLLYWRSRLLQQIKQLTAQHEYTGFITALLLGERGSLNANDKLTLQATGTMHLLAISGLHIGLIASLCYAIVNALWRLSPYLLQRQPAQVMAAGSAFLGAVIYAGLAGFSVSTQRALIMLCVWVLASILRSYITVWHLFSIALVLVLCANPLMSTALGFILSFSAVFILFYSLQGRSSRRRGIVQSISTQAVLMIGLFPVNLLFFHQVSLVAFFANLIAIPIVGFLIVPASVVTLCLSWFSFPLAMSCMHIVLWVLTWLLSFLQALALLPWASWQALIYHPGVWVSLQCGALLLLLPRGWPARYLSSVFFLPLFLYRPPQPGIGEVWFTLLDVGQGLAAVVQTAGHTLLYDTGPRFGDGFDAGRSVIIPYLQIRGIAQIDKIVISHADNDHRGGLSSVLAQTLTGEVITSQPHEVNEAPSTQCLSQQSWDWEGVHFEFLFPHRVSRHARSRNNQSCVLLVTIGRHRILLPGDIEAKAERDILHTQGFQAAPTTLLIAAHHGSRTSSTHTFVNAFRPQYVLFSTGDHNRYHFPHPSIVRRYQRLGAMPLNTARTGAITFKIRKQEVLGPYCYRGACNT